MNTNKPFFIITTGDTPKRRDAIKGELFEAFGQGALVGGIIYSNDGEAEDAFVITLPHPDKFPSYLQAAKNFATLHLQEAFYFVDNAGLLTSFNEIEGSYDSPEFGLFFRQVDKVTADKMREVFIHSDSKDVTYWVID